MVATMEVGVMTIVKIPSSTTAPPTLDTLNQRVKSLEAASAVQSKKLLGTDNTETDLTYTNGLLTSVVVKNGSTIVESTQLNYSNGVLQSVVTTVGNTVITDTLVYTSGKLSAINRGW